MSDFNTAWHPVENTGGRSIRESFKPLGEVCSFVRGVSFDSGDTRPAQAKGLMPVLRAGNIKQTIIFDQDLIWIPDEKVSADQRLRMGDILICLSSGSTSVVGKTCRVEKEWSGTVGAFCGIIRPWVESDSEYIALWFQSSRFTAWRDATARGAGIQNLSFSDMANLELLWPSSQARAKIAKRLRETLAEAAAARKAAKEQLREAESLPAKFLREVLSGCESHARRSLGDILRLRKEVVHPRNSPMGKSTFVGLEHIETQTGRRLASVPVEMSELTGRKPRFFKGDIVYGYLRPYLNKVWLADFDGLCSVDQYVFTVSEDADKEYVAWFMRSPLYLERAPISKAPGQLPRIRTDEVAGVEIEFPPLPEQRRISEQINEYFQDMQKLRDSLSDKLADIEKLPAALLREAFTGAT